MGLDFFLLLINRTSLLVQMMHSKYKGPRGSCCQGQCKLRQRIVRLWESAPPPVTTNTWGFSSGFGICAAKCLYQRLGDARSDHHLLGRCNKKKGMPLISLSAGIIRPFIFCTSWFKRGEQRGGVDIGTVRAAVFQPSGCPSHFAAMIYKWPCNMASLGSTGGIHPCSVPLIFLLITSTCKETPS